MRIAVPVWGDKISPVLDTASRLQVFELVENTWLSELETFLEEKEISRRCSRIRNLKIDTIICGAISRTMSDILAAAGINIIAGIAGSYMEVLNAYQEGCLFCERFLMPGYDQDMKQDRNNNV
jgi:predicted Fe-Mo cluster-binding NifX family protein